MTYFNDLQAAGRTATPRIYYFVILCLLSYILVDVVLYHSGNSPCADLVFDAAKAESKTDETIQDGVEDPICNSVLGHLDSEPKLPVAKAWNQMKWVGSPANCKVKGHLIESLDVANNFRRGFALKYVTNVEDKMQVLPWLYGTKVDLNKRARRVYLDLGANDFHTSVRWFMRMYPCDFTEVHAWEVSNGLFRIPSPGFNEDSNWSPENPHSTRVTVTPQVPDWMANRIAQYNTFVADSDSDTSINITRFMKEDLKLKAEDTVVVKMDIEGAEWPILQRWINDPEMASIIDELFVEVHYTHPSMFDFGWNLFTHPREEAHKLLANLRARGYFAHAWP